ncbi:MAG: TIGR03618 family F420-dependent PPOX class oxidoreductase [Gaiellales bacterium]
MGFEITDIDQAGGDRPFDVGSRRMADSIDDLAPHYVELIDGPYVVTLATLASTGRMQLSPMWFRASLDRRHVEINTVTGRVKDRHMRRHPHVSVQIIDPKNPYHWLTIYGDIVDVIPEGDPERGAAPTESIDTLAELYVNQRPYPFRSGDEERVLHVVAPTQIVTFGGP